MSGRIIGLRIVGLRDDNRLPVLAFVPTIRRQIPKCVEVVVDRCPTGLIAFPLSMERTTTVEGCTSAIKSASQNNHSPHHIYSLEIGKHLRNSPLAGGLLAINSVNCSLQIFSDLYSLVTSAGIHCTPAHNKTTIAHITYSTKSRNGSRCKSKRKYRTHRKPIEATSSDP